MAYLEQIIGNNLKKYRKARDLTLEKLAEKIDINYQNLSKIENGKGFLTAETFEKLCEALMITPAQLVDIDSNNLPEKINQDGIKLLLLQLIRTLDDNKSQALYKLILAFLEAIKD